MGYKEQMNKDRMDQQGKCKETPERTMGTPGKYSWKDLDAEKRTRTTPWKR